MRWIKLDFRPQLGGRWSVLDGVFRGNHDKLVKLEQLGENVRANSGAFLSLQASKVKLFDGGASCWVN